MRKLELELVSVPCHHASIRGKRCFTDVELIVDIPSLFYDYSSFCKLILSSRGNHFSFFIYEIVSFIIIHE